jgi:SAM-dependent methyltransferase
VAVRNTWSDQEYLREVQYRTPDKLTARANLHAKYGTAATAWFPWLVAQITWPSNGNVLDVGCGPGWMWEQASRDLPAGLRLTLSDLSPAMVRSAAQRARGLSRFASVEAREGDAQELPFPDETFDVVVANHMLYHVPEPSLAVAQIARVLRAHGCLLAATNGAGNLRELRELSAGVFGDAVADVTMTFNADSGGEILRASFGDVEWRNFADTLECTDAEDIVAYLTSSSPGENATPEELRILRVKIADRLDAGNGVMKVSKETGAFVARTPLRSVPGRSS